MEELIGMLEEVKKIGEEILEELQKRKALQERILEQVRVLEQRGLNSITKIAPNTTTIANSGASISGSKSK